MQNHDVQLWTNHANHLMKNLYRTNPPFHITAVHATDINLLNSFQLVYWEVAHCDLGLQLMGREEVNQTARTFRQIKSSEQLGYIVSVVCQFTGCGSVTLRTDSVCHWVLFCVQYYYTSLVKAIDCWFQAWKWCWTGQAKRVCCW